jgi:hypothetical protein
MLAGDPIEATEQAQKFLKDKSLTVYYDEVLMGGLKLAQSDAEGGSLDQERMQRIRDAIAEIVDDLSAHQDKTEEATSAQVRYAVRRIRRKAPDAFILVSLLNGSDQIEDAETMQLSPDTGLVNGSLDNTVQRILDLANGATAERPLSEVSGA